MTDDPKMIIGVKPQPEPAVEQSEISEPKLNCEPMSLKKENNADAEIAEIMKYKKLAKA